MQALDDNASGASLLHDAYVLVADAWSAQPRRLATEVGLLVVAGLTSGLSMLMLIPVVNSVSAASGEVAIKVPVLDQLDLHTVPLPILLLGVIALVAGQALTVRAGAINSLVLQQRLVDGLRGRAFGAVLGARWTFVLRSRRSTIIEIATIGASRAGTAFSALLQAAVSTVLGVATAVVSMVIAPALTVVVLVGMGLLMVVQLRSLRPAHVMGREFGRRNRILQSVMLDSMDSLRLVRAHDANGMWGTELSAAFADIRHVQLTNVRRTSTVSAVGTIGLVASAAALVLVAVQLDVPTGTIVLVLVFAARLAGYVRALSSSLQSAANTLPAVRDLHDLIARAQAEAEVTVPARELPPARTSAPIVRMVGVSFTYPGSDEGVTDLTFDVPSGQITALVGPSGAGKSTVADLVLGLLAPTHGRVEVEGATLTPEVVAAWRRRIAYVPQETILLPGSVRRNLTWSIGDRSVSDEECWAALDAASAGFIRSLPAGLDNELGDRGSRLSGGQRQRLAVARALLRQPDLLVMDEATSALDDTTQKALMSVIAGLAPRMTVLLIAHRRETVASADCVIELAEGRVVSQRAAAHRSI